MRGLLPEVEPAEDWVDVKTLPTAFGRKAEACERCKAGLLLADGETLVQFSHRQRCKTAGCKRKTAIPGAPEARHAIAGHPDVLPSTEALAGNGEAR